MNNNQAFCKGWMQHLAQHKHQLTRETQTQKKAYYDERLQWHYKYTTYEMVSKEGKHTT